MGWSRGWFRTQGAAGPNSVVRSFESQGRRPKKLGKSKKPAGWLSPAVRVFSRIFESNLVYRRSLVPQMEYLLLYKLKQFKFIANWLIFFCAFQGGRRAIPSPLKGWVYGIEIRLFCPPNFADSGVTSKGARCGRFWIKCGDLCGLGVRKGLRVLEGGWLDLVRVGWVG